MIEQKFHPILVRSVAMALQYIFRENQYADKVIEKTLRENPKAGARDRAFIAETTYEIVRFYRLYEAVLGQAPTTPTDFWRLVGVYFIDKGQELPAWAEFYSLRPREILEELSQIRKKRVLRESIPDWMDELGERELGEKWESVLHALNQPAQVILRTNRLKTNRLDLQKQLLAEGYPTKILGEEPSEALVLEKRANVFRTEAFKNGWFEVQDFSSQQVARFLDIHPGQRVVDACAGAGGKTLHLAALLENKGNIIAMDTLAWKLDELKIRGRRAGTSNIQTREIENSKTIKRLHGTADRLLLDVPCSGLGVLRRNPDSKWKLKPEFIENIKKTQAEILQNYSPICKAGGKMVYATCSILPSENREQVDKFLASEAGAAFQFLEEKIILPEKDGFDGFYMALLEKI